jgi:hypothetical protein
VLLSIPTGSHLVQAEWRYRSEVAPLCCGVIEHFNWLSPFRQSQGIVQWSCNFICVEGVIEHLTGLWLLHSQGIAVKLWYYLCCECYWAFSSAHRCGGRVKVAVSCNLICAGECYWALSSASPVAGSESGIVQWSCNLFVLWVLLSIPTGLTAGIPRYRSEVVIPRLWVLSTSVSSPLQNRVKVSCRSCKSVFVTSVTSTPNSPL